MIVDRANVPALIVKGPQLTAGAEITGGVNGESIVTVAVEVAEQVACFAVAAQEEERPNDYL